jgi:deazaflavin-dependent oxidoreductase (nitroreductase family)
MDVMSLASRSRPALRLLIGSHTRIYRVTSGLVGHRFPGAPPMLLLDHVGPKSGIKRTTPLVYVEDDHDVVIVASKGGQPRNPAWYHNARANPDTMVQIGAGRRAVHERDPRARTAWSSRLLLGDIPIAVGEALELGSRVAGAGVAELLCICS